MLSISSSLKKLVFSIALIFSFQKGCQAQQPGSLISSLPGLAAPLNFNQYSGYITVNAQNNRQLFYWFVESQNSASGDPVVLWQTGGPGCSSLSALLSENGPFYVDTDGKTLFQNPYSWNRNASVLYVESPANVGFSFSDAASDNNPGDASTASDLVEFVHQFLTIFPNLQNNPFWLTGESYGGHYVPNLALAIYNANQAGQTPKINIQGFAVGNAWTVAALDNAGCPLMWWSHGIISDEQYKAINDNCDFSNIGPLTAPEQAVLRQARGASSSVSVNPALCDLALYSADSVMSGVYIYNLYKDVCLEDGVRRGKKMNQATMLMSSVASAVAELNEEDNNAANVFAHVNRERKHKSSQKQDRRRRRSDVGSGAIPDTDPCIDSHVENWLNQVQVQQAIHVASPPVAWSECSNTLNYSRKDLLSSMLPVYEALLKTDLKVNVYSGDIDGIVPVTGTKNWLAAAPFNISKTWRAWTDSEGQTGGFVQEYTYGSSPNPLRFITVRGSGHMVPLDTPARAYDLFERILNGEDI